MKNTLLFVSILFVNSIYCQSINYRIAAKFEQNNKLDKALKWYLKSEKSLDANQKPQFFEKVFNISINIDSGFYGGRSEYLNIALKYHTKYAKLKNSEISINQDQTLKLKKEIKDELVQILSSKKRNNALYTFYKENSLSAEDELILVLYDLSRIANKSDNEWIIFYEAYNKMFKDGLGVDLSPKSEIIFYNCIEDLLDQSFLEISPGITRTISELKYFKMSYGLKLKNQVLNLYKEVEENRNENDFEFLYKLWNLEKEIYKVNPDLLDKEILKITYLKRVVANAPSYIGNALNDFILNQNCIKDDNICFDSDPFYYSGIEELKDKPLVMNNQLIQLVFLYAVEYKLNEERAWYMMNPIESALKSDSAFRLINSTQLLKEHLSRNYKHYSDYAETCLEYPEFNKTFLADLLFELTKERISSLVIKKDFSSATKEFFASVKMFPNRNWNDQKKWFYVHFESRLKLKETQFMGKEILIATHFFSSDKDFVVLIRQYRKAEVEITLKKNNIKPDSWTGNTKTCDCGSMSEEYMNAALESMKFFRRYAGLPDSLYFREKENNDAQCAALIMQAMSDRNNGEKIYLNHHPKTTDLCYSTEGFYGASHGNLMYGTAMSGVASTYMDDFGLESTGHRSWVLSPDLVSYGFGSTTNANCLVWGDSETRNDLNNFYKLVPFSWPPASFVEYELIEEADKWTFALQGADFSGASIIVISNKKEIPVKIAYHQGFLNGGYGTFSYINFDIGMEEITEKTDYSSWTFWRSKAKKGQKYEISIDNVIDFWGIKRAFKYSIEII